MHCQVIGTFKSSRERLDTDLTGTIGVDVATIYYDYDYDPSASATTTTITKYGTNQYQ